MREILHKAITNDAARVWVKGILLPNTAQITVEIPDPNYPGNFYHSYYDVCVETASQLIYRKADGEEVYTNDLFKYKDEVYKIEWPEGNMSPVGVKLSDDTVYNLDDFILKDIEIVGNIYDDFIPPTFAYDGVEKGD